jgi:hypothetical protein
MIHDTLGSVLAAETVVQYSLSHIDIYIHYPALTGIDDPLGGTPVKTHCHKEKYSW